MIILKNHYMLIGEYIFVIFRSLFVKINFRGVGIGFWNMTFSHQIFWKKLFSYFRVVKM